MNKIILMLGSIIFFYFFFLVITPDYEKVKKKIKDVDKENYMFRVNILAFLFSLMINFLTWGWFI